MRGGVERSPALIVVPPFLKSAGAPLLGPALLAGAARAAGFAAAVLDLNARWMEREAGPAAMRWAGPFVGDHDRPTELLRPLQRAWSSLCAPHFPMGAAPGFAEDPFLTLTWSHAEVDRAARGFAAGPFGEWASRELDGLERPLVVGVSVMYSGQVLAALALSVVAKERWPGVRVVWGGAHVTALRDAIAADPAYGAHVDGFVFGYAERTWIELLRAEATGGALPAEVVRAGGGSSLLAVDDASVVPTFDLPGGRLTLPAQASRGCAYGRCTFCTYPSVEGEYRPGDLAPVLHTVELAASVGAAVSFKDSLVVPARLERIAALIDGRVRWSACTKLHPRLDGPLLRRLAAAGCATLEVGLETLTPSGQLVIEKPQTLPLFLAFLDAAAAAGISVVVNYITGFPGADAADEQVWLAVVRAALAERQPRLVAKVEHNTFQLERLSPMGKRPADFGLRVVERWPWASVVAWEPAVEEQRGVG